MKSYDIYERIFNFIIDVINLLDKLSRTPTNLVFINQATRSVSSIGANGQEADGALTKKDFIHNLTLARKEGKETLFWLRLIEKTNSPKFSLEVQELIKEGNEIVAIISTIIKNAAKHSKTCK